MRDRLPGSRGLSASIVTLIIAGLAGGALQGCSSDGNDLLPTGAPGNDNKEPAAPVWTAGMPAGQRMFFFDNFQNGLPSWEPMAGAWEVTQQGSSLQYTAGRREYALSYAGNPNWSNYTVSAQVIIDDDRHGQVGIVGRGDSDHYYFELVLGRNPQGQRGWAIRQRLSHRWTTLATGPFDYQMAKPYVMRLSFRGSRLEGSISADSGGSWATLGAGEAPASSWRVGRAGVVTYGGAARFDDVGVTGDEELIAAVDLANGWGPVSLLRDNTTTFPTGKPTGGWYVTPIHVTLRPDGKVLVTGFSRKAASGCTSGATGTQRENGMTWLLDPAALDSAADMSTLLTTPINEQNLDPGRDVLYCAGHSPLADGRVFFTAGTRYTDGLPDSNPERGLRYSRIFGGTSIARVATNGGTYHFMQGGQSGIAYPDPGAVGDGGTVSGEKWYPTTLLMPDGKVLIFGGFHWSAASMAGVKPNNSFEVFDTGAWDANHNANPYSVLSQHTTTGISGDLPPTRGYSNMLLLPRPVAAGSAGGFARSVAIYGGKGRVALFNHEPGSFSPDTARLFAGANALTISPEGVPANERAEGGSGVLLSDGRIMIFNGGHTGDGAKRAYVYNPYTDTWLSPTGAACTTASCSLNTFVSRMYGQAVQLPDGQVMIINGFGAQSGDGQAFEEMGNETDIADAEGDPRQPVLVDPYATPSMTADPQPIWPEPTHRGYHSVSLLLKDGRILVGGGKDKDHATGCEKNELRIYTPPYLQGNPTRPAVTNITEGQNIQVGSGTFTINYTGTLKSTRGVALVALGSLTHAFDMGQRYVPLTVVSGGGATGSVTVRAPTNINVAQPGYYTLFVVDSAGVPSMGVSVRLTPPPTCLYAVNGNAHSYIEAELSSRKDGPFVTTADAGRSNGNYVDVTEGSGNHTTVPDEGKVMWYDVNVTNGGDFFLWALVNAPDTGGDTAYVSVNGGADIQLTASGTPGTWNWVRLSATASAINGGVNTLKVKVREDGLKIDKLVLTKSGSLTPSGITNTVQSCNGPAIPNAPTATPGNGQVALSWSAVTGATSYTVRWGTSSGNYTSSQSGITGTSTTVSGLTNGTTYFFAVSAHTATLASGLSNETAAAPASGPQAPPPPWVTQDIGAVAAPGNSTYVAATGTHTVVGNGADIWTAADEFRFTHQSITGDATITARLTGFTGTGTINANAKAGVMIRQNVMANSPHVLSCLPVQGQATLIKQVRRLTSGATSTSASGAAATFPRWVRAVRSGNSLSTFESTNGTSWTQVGTPQTIATLGATAFFGLAVTSHVDGTNYTATFDNVSITTPMPQPPGPPTNLVCTPGDNQCACTWTAPAGGASSYNVKRSLVSGSGHTPIVTNHTPTSYTDTAAVNGTAHFYVVSANNTAGEGNNSSQASCTPVPPPTAPSDLTVIGGVGQATLNWIDNASDENGFKIDRKPFGSPDTSFAEVAQVGANVQSYLDTPLAAGGYTWRVRAFNSSGHSPYSNSADATVTAPAGPAAPSNLSATITGGNSVNLTWSDNSTTETGFRVERKTGAGAYSTLATKAVNVTSHSDTTVTAGNTYTYRVVATGSPDSPASNEVVAVLRGMEADAYVRGGTNGTLNYGAATALEAKLNTTPPENNRESFVRFTLTDVQATVVSAKLRIFGNANTTAKIIGISGVSNITWVEGTGTGQAVAGITYNTKPAIGSQITSQSVGITAGFWEFDITSYVQAQRTAGATKVSLSIVQVTSSTNGQTSFTSRENATVANRPLVVISSRP